MAHGSKAEKTGSVQERERLGTEAQTAPHADPAQADAHPDPHTTLSTLPPAPHNFWVPWRPLGPPA